ncbi:MAG: LptF/LptG family permease [Bacteroidales bacterium]|nr:LptF/LptG family permease [Bacteroidales bacterium]
MKKLDIFTIKSFIGPLIATFFISLFVLLMQFLWKYIDELVGKGLDTSVIVELLFYASITLIPMALPLAILLASIMTFGNLGEKFELTAIKAAGISLQRAMRPLIIMSVLISLGAFIIANDIIPMASLKMHTLLWSIKQQRPEMNIKPGIFNNDLGEVSIRISKKDPVTNMMYNFRIYDHQLGKGNYMVTIADSGSVKMTDDNRYLILTLYSGVTYQEDEDKSSETDKKYAHRINTFDQQTIMQSMAGFDFDRSDESLFRNNYQVMNLVQLKHSGDSLQNEFENIAYGVSNTLSNSYYLKNAKHTHQAFTDSIKAELAKLNNHPNEQHIIVHDLERNLDTQNNKDSAYLRQDSITKVLIARNKDSLREIFSVPPEDIKVIINLDSLLQTLPDDKYKQVKNKTKEFANEARTFVSRNAEEIQSKQKTMSKFRNAWHQKITLSIACLIFFFIGAPLGAIIRKGGFGLPIVVSVLVFIIYYIISTAGMKMSREGIWQPWQGMWLSTIVILPLGVFLTYKATVDAQLFNKEAWQMAWNKVAGFFKVFGKLKDTGSNTDHHPVRSYCLNIGLIAAAIALAFAFTPTKNASFIFGGLALILAAITFVINKKLGFKHKFVIITAVLAIAGITIAAVTYKKKAKRAASKPQTETTTTAPTTHIIL